MYVYTCASISTFGYLEYAEVSPDHRPFPRPLEPWEKRLHRMILLHKRLLMPEAGNLFYFVCGKPLLLPF